MELKPPSQINRIITFRLGRSNFNAVGYYNIAFLTMFLRVNSIVLILFEWNFINELNIRMKSQHNT